MKAIANRQKKLVQPREYKFARRMCFKKTDRLERRARTNRRKERR